MSKTIDGPMQAPDTRESGHGMRRALDADAKHGVQLRSARSAAMVGQSRAVIDHVRGPVQAHGAMDGPSVHAVAADGISGPSRSLPHMGAIQKAFGKHDVGHVQAHVGGPAAAATAKMGADAYATGRHVAFGREPSLHTAAHEAAHVVQQKAGVSLAGGVGQVGDPYERHADAVADRVVQGKSAEDLLDQSPAGSGGAGSVQHNKPKGGDTGSGDKSTASTGDKDGGTTTPTATTTPGGKLSTLLDLIKLNYEHQLTLGQKAVKEVEEDAAKKPAAKLDAILLKALAELALSAATGGAGALIVGKLAKGAAQAAQDAMNDAIKDGIKMAVGGAVSAAAKGGGAKASLKGFFRGQWDTLTATNHKVQTAYLKDVKPRLLNASDGEAQAQKLYDAQEAAEKQYKQMQRQQTLEKWLVYLARTDLGKTKGGGTNLGSAIGDTSTKGVLGLRFTGGYSPDPVKIIDAEMDGVGDELAAEIAALPIGKLNIPITAKGTVKYAQQAGNAVFGRNEKGQLWDNSTWAGLGWLYGKGNHGPELWNHPRNIPPVSHLRENRWVGIGNVLKNEIEGKTLKDLKVKITTEGGVLD